MLNRKVVMISSTARDLPKHREQVRLACERAGFEPREMMEHLTAEHASLPKEAPRLCRGGSRSLTFTAVVHRRDSPFASHHAREKRLTMDHARA